MKFLNKKKLGKTGEYGENAAADYLAQIGYEIIGRNVICDGHEIDIIAKNGDIIVFVEVKKRNDDKLGRPEEYVTYSKRKKIISCAQKYIYKNNIEDKKFRFDVIAITGEEIEHIVNAFDGSE